MNPIKYYSEPGCVHPAIAEMYEISMKHGVPSIIFAVLPDGHVCVSLNGISNDHEVVALEMAIQALEGRLGDAKILSSTKEATPN